jgi:dolichol-phosphate mannosyltransferase
VISIVVPTYREAESIPLLARAIDDVLGGKESYELLFVDDDSQDGSEAAVETLARTQPVRIVVRRGERGLATAVLRGIAETSGEQIVVMDADLSHPPSAIPEMVRLLRSGEADFVIGSRYVAGGSIHENWGLFRTLNSRVPSLLARPLAAVRDPMSGFFALRRPDMPDPGRLAPIGYKIGLEILVRGEFEKVREIPIHFAERRAGASKLTIREQLRFLEHVARLYRYRYRTATELVQFGMVGGSGFLVDLGVYLGFQFELGIEHRIARARSFLAAASWNWAWNRAVTFGDRPKTSKAKQWPAFVLSSILGFCVNWGCYTGLTGLVPFFDRNRILALAAGVVAGMGLNFVVARRFVFKRARRARAR